MKNLIQKNLYEIDGAICGLENRLQDMPEIQSEDDHANMSAASYRDYIREDAATTGGNE